VCPKIDPHLRAHCIDFRSAATLPAPRTPVMTELVLPFTIPTEYSVSFAELVIE